MHCAILFVCRRPQRRKSVYNFEGIDTEGIGESASALRTKLLLPKTKSPSRLGDPGASYVPSGVWGGAPEADAIVNILFQNVVHFGHVNLIFVSMKIVSERSFY